MVGASYTILPGGKSPIYNQRSEQHSGYTPGIDMGSDRFEARDGMDAKQRCAFTNMC